MTKINQGVMNDPNEVLVRIRRTLERGLPDQHTIDEALRLCAIATPNGAEAKDLLSRLQILEDVAAKSITFLEAETIFHETEDVGDDIEQADTVLTKAKRELTAALKKAGFSVTYNEVSGRAAGKDNNVDNFETVLGLYGFESQEEFHRLLDLVDTSSAEKMIAFKAWQLGDGTKAGLEKLCRLAKNS